MSKPAHEFIEAFARLKKKFFFEKAMAAGSEGFGATVPARRPDEKIIGFGYRTESGLLAVSVFAKEPVDSESVIGFLHRVGLDENPFEVLVTGEIIASSSMVCGGHSIGRTGYPGGTLACTVRTRTGVQMGLSCSHILNPTNTDEVGRAEIVHRNSLEDDSGNVIGVLAAFKPIDFSEDGENIIDAALFRPVREGAMSGCGNICQIGTVAGVSRRPDFGAFVKKYGACTHYTEGALMIQDAAAVVTFPAGTKAIFNKLLVFRGMRPDKPFSRQGDSGALIVNENNLASGLLVATASGMDLTFGNCISEVLDHFGAEIP